MKAFIPLFSSHSRPAVWALALLLFILPARVAESQIMPGQVPAPAKERQTLTNRVTAAVARLPVLGPLPAEERLQLAIGLPLRNRDILTNLFRQLYDIRSTNFHRYLTPDEFAEQFGPTEQDYQSVKDYAVSNGMQVVGTYGNRALVDVAGKVTDLEKAFQVHLGWYRHPAEDRQFYAPDRAPSVEAGLPISFIRGLDNYSLPQPSARPIAQGSTAPQPGAQDGSGTNGLYLAKDLRDAYVPGVSLKGDGQIIGLVEYTGYTPGDVTKYESIAGLTSAPAVQPDILPGASGTPCTNCGSFNLEVALDIDMVIGMASGASVVRVVEGTSDVDVMTALATTNSGVPLASQISSSWTLSLDTDCETALMEMAAQGQTFYICSFDASAPTNGVQSSATDQNYLTTVGGSELAMSNNSTAWQGETVWNDGPGKPGAGIEGSTGYVETDLAIPDYQKAVNTSANGGSTVNRNVPDVAMVADWLEIVQTVTFTNNQATETGQIGGAQGTSAAAPLWAGFTALVNQQAVAAGKPTLGFANPALYSIAGTALYNSCFHDVTVGNNSNTYSANLYIAGPGYDNCTGLGTPNGINLINALVGYTGPCFVEFGYNGAENGSFYEPFNTLAKGVNAVSNYGTIFILNGGSSSETPVISKPMTITAQDGTATVGN